MTEAGSMRHQCECEMCKAGNDAAIDRYHEQINLFLSHLNELQRRWYVGTISQAPYSPKDQQLALISGLDEKTI